MIELNDTTVGIWFIGVDDTQDWMGALSDRGDHFELVYRHRYYTDGDGFFNDDKKNWYNLRLAKDERHQTQELAIEAVRLIVAKFASKTRDKFTDEIVRLVDGAAGTEQMGAVLMAKDWASAQRVH